MPTLRQGSFNQTASDFAIAYQQKADQGAGWSTKIAPRIGVGSEIGTYKIRNKGDWFRDEMQERADGAEAVEADYALSDATYTLRFYSLRHLVTDRRAKNMPIIWPEEAAAEFLAQKALIKADRIAVANLLTAGVGWGTELVGAASAVPGTSVIGWSLANSTPLADLKAGVDAVRAATGLKPNRVGISADVMSVLLTHDDFIPPGGTSITTSVSEIEKAIGVEPGSIFEMGTIYNSAAAGQTATMAYTAAQTVLIAYVTDGPSIQNPTAAATFVHNTLDGMDQSGNVAVSSYRDDKRKGMIYEADLYMDTKLTAADLGFLYTSILT